VQEGCRKESRTKRARISAWMRGGTDGSGNGCFFAQKHRNKTTCKYQHSPTDFDAPIPTSAPRMTHQHPPPPATDPESTEN
jgi:hypothetical protein